MAHFYGTLKGSRGVAASRRGTRNSGFRAIAASWHGAVYTYLYEKDGVDYARVELIPWHGAGIERLLYDGPVDGVPTKQIFKEE
jgi:hypothetical protein|tara:strand:- start:4250 stop:4501 length:252 start_codon:yes stop_codon:yes gene_type:complete